MSHLLKVDHVTYACAKGTIEKWAWYHIEVEGGKLVTRIDDVSPDSSSSSMKLWCIDFGEFGIALVEGIDRAEKSQVTKFVERHGDHSIQHVAYETKNLDQFTERLQQYQCNVLGEPIVKTDAHGLVKQIFCRGYSALSPAESTFAEYVQRPRGLREELEISFSKKAGKGFYKQIEEAMAKEEYPTFTSSFAGMPADWHPPAPESIPVVTPPEAAKDSSSLEVA